MQFFFQAMGISSADFVVRAKKLREAIAALAKSLSSSPLSGKDFELFSSQDGCLKKISSSLGILKPKVEEMSYLYESLSTDGSSDQVRQCHDLLKQEWTCVNQSYIERYNRWAKCNEKLNELKSMCWNFDDYLLKLEVIVKDISANPQSKISKTRMQDVDREVPKMAKMMGNITDIMADISRRGSAMDVKDWQNQVDDLKFRWQGFASNWNVVKNRYEKNLLQFYQLSRQVLGIRLPNSQSFFLV